MVPRTKVQNLTRISLLAALTVLLAVTPLGYIPNPFFPLAKITLMVVPVAVGGIISGWPAGLILGLVFGVTSFFQAPFDLPLGPVLLAHNAALAFVGCVVPRAVVGLLADAAHHLTQKHVFLCKVWFYAAVGLAASLCNTILFLGFLWLFFGEMLTGIGPAVIAGIIGTNGLLEMAVNAILVGALCRGLAAPPGSLSRKKRNGDGK